MDPVFVNKINNIIIQEEKDEKDDPFLLSEKVLASPRYRVFSDKKEDNIAVKSIHSHNKLSNYTPSDDDIIKEDNNENIIEKEDRKRHSRRGSSAEKLDQYLDQSEKIEEVTHDIHAHDNEVIEAIKEEQIEEDTEIKSIYICFYKN